MLNVMRDNLQAPQVGARASVALAMLVLPRLLLRSARRGAGHSADWAARVGRPDRSRRRSSCRSPDRRTTTTGSCFGAQYEPDEEEPQARLAGDPDAWSTANSSSRRSARARTQPRRKADLRRRSSTIRISRTRSGQLRRQGPLYTTSSAATTTAASRGPTSTGSATTSWPERGSSVMTASAPTISDAGARAGAGGSRNVRAAADYVSCRPSIGSVRRRVDAATMSAWYASHCRRLQTAGVRKVRPDRVDRQSQVANAEGLGRRRQGRLRRARRRQYERPEQRPRAAHPSSSSRRCGRRRQGRRPRPAASVARARCRRARTSRRMARSLSQDTHLGGPGRRARWFGRGRDGEAVRRRGVRDASRSVRAGRRDRVRLPRHPGAKRRGRRDSTSFDEVKDSIRRRLEPSAPRICAAAEAKRHRAARSRRRPISDAVAAKAGLKVEDAIYRPTSRRVGSRPSPEFVSGRAMHRSRAGVRSPGRAGTARDRRLHRSPPSAPRPSPRSKTHVKKDVLHRARTRRPPSRARAADRGRGHRSPTARRRELEVKKSGDLSAGAELPASVPSRARRGPLRRRQARSAPGASCRLRAARIAYEVTRHDAFDRAQIRRPRRRAPARTAAPAAPRPAEPWE